jgi:hypothetical protein
MSEHRTNSPKGAGRTARSLRELPQERAPGRDLWPQIETRLGGERATTAQVIEQRSNVARAPEGQPAQPPQARPTDWSGWRVRLAAAIGLLALGAVLTTGVWMTHGRAGHHRPAPGLAPARAPDIGLVSGTSTQLSPLDERGRAAMLRSLSERLQSLPPPSRQKVLADLQVIEQSMQDIQSALGRDPGNALLREMLSESYQDEQHLFATVQEAAVWTQEAGSGKGST